MSSPKSSRDPRVDAYIDDKAADFAKPILRHLRAVIHAVCPEVEEAIKWSMPGFMYKGRMLAGMASFKAHATFGFWQDSQLIEDGRNKEAMGSFGRIEALDDLPPRAELERLVKAAMTLIDTGVKPVRNKTTKAEIPMPEDLADALAQSDAASATFDAFAPSCRREYLEWVTEAKRPETRAKRVAQAVEWMAEGKKRNWKYENC